MEIYNYSKTIPSVKVDKDLITELENYFIYEIPKKIDLTKDEISSCFEISFKDKYSEQTFNSISDFIFQIFPDNIEDLSIGFNFYNYQNEEIKFRVKLLFSISKIKNFIYLEIKTKNGKRIASEIIGDFETILSRKKTNNYLYFPNPFIQIILTYCSIALIALTVIFVNENIKHSVLSLSILSLFLVYLNYLPKAKPYASFDTYKQRQNDKVTNFILLGLFSFLIFSLLLPFLIKWLFN